jgi:hypothetical protein
MSETRAPKYLKAVIEILLSSGAFEPDDFEGCSDTEISYVMTALFQYTQKMPAVYEEFLRLMGKRSGAFMSHESCHFPEILSVRGGILDSLPDEHLFSFPRWKEGIYFSCHDGYEYSFFFPEEDDPEVFIYSEHYPIRSTNLSLSKFLEGRCYGGIREQSLRMHERRNT